MHMAKLVKWLTRQIVALVCMGSIPIFRPINLKSNLKKIKIKEAGHRMMIGFFIDFWRL